MRNKTPLIRRYHFLVCLLTLLVLVSCGEDPSIVFHGGPILTMDQEFQSRDNLCVIVKGQRIAAVRPFDSIDKALFEKAKKVNLEGNLLMPGLIESHGHLYGLGQSQFGLNLAGIKSKPAVLAKIRAYASSLKKGQWLFGRGWDQSDWTAQQFPTARELDQILPDHPAVLYRIGGHTAWLNSKALELAGINKATKDPDGGKIVRDADGRPTGILMDNAMNLVGEFADVQKVKNPVKVLRAAQREAFRNGITTFHDLAFPGNRLFIYKWLYRLGLLKINVHVYVLADDDLEEYITQHRPQSLSNGRLTIGAIKAFYDGAMGSLIQECGLTESDFRGKRFADFPFDVKGNNDLLSITQPHIIRMIHDKYLAAGSDIIETNTFNANRFSQADYHLEDVVWEMNMEAARIAHDMAAIYTERDPERPRFVAGAMGPTNKTASLSPDVNNPGFRAVTFDEMADVYGEQASGLIEGGVDIMVLETIFDTLNAKAAIFALEQLFRKLRKTYPVIISGTITDASGRTLSGQTLQAFINSVSHMDVLALGLNCSLGAKEIRPYLEELSGKTHHYDPTISHFDSMLSIYRARA